MSSSEEAQRVERALELAYRNLNRRERTVGEVRAHLEAHGIDPTTAEEALGRLQEDGFLDDRRYVRLFIEDKRELEQWGAERIRRTLLARGVERELVDEGLARADGDGEASELERALALLRRRFPQAPSARRERDRALGVLLRKGFETEIALDALAVHSRAGP